MEPNHRELSTPTERNRRSEFMVERDKFQKNFQEFLATSEKQNTILLELERLRREHACLQWDIRYLEEKINHLARRVNLEPLSRNGHNTQPNRSNGNS